MEAQKMRDYEIKIRNLISKAMELYYINSVMQQEDYESKMVAILSELCDEAITFGLCQRKGYRMRQEQFGKYKWHLEHIGLKEFDMFKIIGDITKMMDDDEYYWKPKQELNDD